MIPATKKSYLLWHSILHRDYVYDCVWPCSTVVSINVSVNVSWGFLHRLILTVANVSCSVLNTTSSLYCHLWVYKKWLTAKSLSNPTLTNHHLNPFWWLAMSNYSNSTWCNVIWNVILVILIQDVLLLCATVCHHSSHTPLFTTVSDCSLL